MAHVSEHGEDDGAAVKRGERVDARDVGAVGDKVAVVLVVRAERDHAAEGAAERVEHLRAGVDPDLYVWEGDRRETGRLISAPEFPVNRQYF